MIDKFALSRIRLLTEDEVFKDEEGGRMEDKLTIQDLQEQLKVSTGYMLGITFLKDGLLTHHFMTNNFPTGDIKISLIEIRKLALAKPEPIVVENIDESKK